MPTAWVRQFRAWLPGLLRHPTDTGSRGELAAEQFLIKLGYRILARNLRTRLGEIDLLVEAEDGRTIVLVEVKTADGDSNADYPEIHVNLAKQRKLTALACRIVQQYKLEDRPIRFDVIGVILQPDGNHTIRHHLNAFEATV